MAGMNRTPPGLQYDEGVRPEPHEGEPQPCRGGQCRTGEPGRRPLQGPQGKAPASPGIRRAPGSPRPTPRGRLHLREFSPGHPRRRAERDPMGARERAGGGRADNPTRKKDRNTGEGIDPCRRGNQQDTAGRADARSRGPASEGTWPPAGPEHRRRTLAQGSGWWWRARRKPTGSTWRHRRTRNCQRSTAT